MHCRRWGIDIVVEDHYCFECGVRELVNYDLRDEKDFIEYYFKRFFRYFDISSTRYLSQTKNEYVFNCLG